MLPFLKLTASLPLKINGWKMGFLLGPIFGGYVCFREGISLQNCSYLIHIISDRFISNFIKFPYISHFFGFGKIIKEGHHFEVDGQQLHEDVSKNSAMSSGCDWCGI